MFGFFLKKNFCDVWDNLFYLILTNVLPVAIGVGSYFAISASAAINPYLPNAVFVLCAGVLMSVLFAVLVLVVRIAFSFYLGMYLKNGSLMSILLAAVLAWFFFIVVMALQWFVPLYFLQEDNTFGKNLKKSFIVYFDNAGFSFLMLLHNLVLCVLTILTFGLIPGLNGITLSCTNACRLRLYKYDWFEEHPEYLEDKEKRASVPWDELIADDKESLGQRKLSSFLCPWK